MESCHTSYLFDAVRAARVSVYHLFLWRTVRAFAHASLPFVGCVCTRSGLDRDDAVSSALGRAPPRRRKSFWT